MTDHISIRTRPGLKAAVLLRAKPNVNAWLNRLIERELAAENPDWRDILKGERPAASESLFQQCLKPE